MNVPTTYGGTDPSVSYNGTSYYLLQFHAHTTSEHTIAGTSYPMEFHFVHATNATATAQYLVVGVMFNIGAESPVLRTMLTQDPGEECIRERLSDQVELGSLLPANRSFYHYSPGSLTTPPCTEGLNWFVMSEALTVGAEQVAEFGRVVHGRNNRPEQPLSGRMVTRYTAP